MKGLMLVLLVAISAVGTSAGQNPQRAEADSPKFALTISTPQETVKSGSKIVVNIRWTNRSGRKIGMGTVGESGIYDYKVDIQSEDRKVPPRTKAGRAIDDGVVIRNDLGPIGGAPIKQLEDGESQKQTIAITDLFTLGPGKYTIQLERKGTTVKSNIVVVNVTP